VCERERERERKRKREKERGGRERFVKYTMGRKGKREKSVRQRGKK